MKILHIATLNSAASNIGVVRQMQYEQDSARHAELDWTVELWVGAALEEFDFIKAYPANCRSRLSRRFYFIKVLREASKHYDVILLRYMPGDIFLPFFVSAGARICFVHHSKEGISLKSIFPGFKGIALSFVERFLAVISLRRADAVVGVTPELVKYELSRAFLKGKKSYVYPNGIDYKKFDLVDDRRSGKIKIFFIASRFFAWHGLSQILESLARFSHKDKVELHLIGEVFSSDREAIVRLDLCDQVILHGSLSLQELRNQLATADVGLASFGLGEAGIEEACTLKVREYLAAGVPVYSGHVDVGLSRFVNFYRVGLADFSDIYIYACRMRRIGRLEVRKQAQEYIDKGFLVRRLHGWLSDSFREQ